MSRAAPYTIVSIKARESSSALEIGLLCFQPQVFQELSGGLVFTKWLKIPVIRYQKFQTKLLNYGQLF
jgi:hypothetical protein